MSPERPETVPDEETAHVLHLVNPDHGGRALVLNLVERLQRLHQGVEPHVGVEERLGQAVLHCGTGERQK